MHTFASMHDVAAHTDARISTRIFTLAWERERVEGKDGCTAAACNELGSPLFASSDRGAMQHAADGPCIYIPII